MDIEKITQDGVCYVTVEGKPTYKEAFVTPIGERIEFKNNTIIMHSAYETTYPYAKYMLTYIYDDNGGKHILDHNIFVGPDASKKEGTNYIYQDTALLSTLTHQKWREHVQDFIRDKPNARLHTIEPDLGDAPFSFNRAWQLFRYLEIATEEEVATGDYTDLRPPKDNRWDWDKWNRGGFGEFKACFAKEQGDLIKSGLTYNLNKYGIQVNLKELKVVVGRVDPRYKGIISFNFCCPDKELNFEKDLKRFDNGKRLKWLFAAFCAMCIPFTPDLHGRAFLILLLTMLLLSSADTVEYVRLHADDHPHLFDISKPFIVAPESFPPGFFNKEASDFAEFLFSGKCAGQELRAVLIGANENGLLYSSLLCD